MSGTDRADKFTADAGDLAVSQCALCRHRPDSGRYPVCQAFPGWIPDPILTNAADHRHPFEGDQGVRFEPRPGVPRDALHRLYDTLDRVHPTPN